MDGSDVVWVGVMLCRWVRSRRIMEIKKTMMMMCH